MTQLVRQIGNVAARALIRRRGIAVSIDMVLLLREAARSGTVEDAHHRQLGAAKRGLIRMLADAVRLERRVAHSQAEAARWQARAERALRAGDAALARQALVRKLQVQRIAGHYAEAQTVQQRSLDQVQVAVAQLEARLHDVQAVHAPGWAPLAWRDQATVDAHWEQFELDQAMDSLRRTVQG